MEDNRLLKPTDIPLIITSQMSSPEGSGRSSEPSRKRTSDKKKSRSSTASGTGTVAASGSLKYEIGARDSSITNLKIPTKWSSVRIKGTGFNESRKSVVKIEPCNGMPNVNLNNKDSGHHLGLKSPNPAPIKEVTETVSYCLQRLYCMDPRVENVILFCVFSYLCSVFICVPCLTSIERAASALVFSSVIPSFNSRFAD